VKYSEQKIKHTVLWVSFSHLIARLDKNHTAFQTAKKPARKSKMRMVPVQDLPLS
jgi:hypothetical protein